MVESHTISAPEKTWQRVYAYAEKNGFTIAEVTKQAWDEFFKEEKQYRKLDFLIIILLVAIFILLIQVVVL